MTIRRSEEHTSESSHSQISYAVFCFKRDTSHRDLHSTHTRPTPNLTRDPTDETVNATIRNAPALEALNSADLMLNLTRFLSLPDDQLEQNNFNIAVGKPVEYDHQ